MKKIFFCFLLLTVVIVQAQDKKAYELNVKGVKVVVVPSGNEIVQMDLVIRGGVQNFPANKAGIERLALTALTECGTANDDKNSFKDKLDEVDARIYSYIDKDASHFLLNCIDGDFESVWPLYVDALTAPRFDAKEFARIKEEALNSLRQAVSNSDVSLQRMAMQTAFKGMDYAKFPSGTIPTVEKLTLEQTKAYYKSLLTRSRIFIVVVGDFNREKLEQKLGELISKIPVGKPVAFKRQTYVPKTNSFAAQPKDNATNYIMGISSAPQANSKDYYASTLASGLFYNKMFLEVRTNNGLSYAPAAYISSGMTPYSVMYVTTTDPNKYVAVARNLVDKIKKEGFPVDDVQNMKNTYATYQYYDNETNESLCFLVANSELLQGDWHKAFTLKEDLRPVTPADVHKVFTKYIGNFTWVYQGNTKQVTPSLFTQKATPPVPKEKKAF